MMTAEEWHDKPTGSNNGRDGHKKLIAQINDAIEAQTDAPRPRQDRPR